LPGETRGPMPLGADEDLAAMHNASLHQQKAGICKAMWG
jgi:hypothetical protein